MLCVFSSLLCFFISQKKKPLIKIQDLPNIYHIKKWTLNLTRPYKTSIQNDT